MEFASEEEKEKLAELLLTVPEGPESMVVSGGVVSGGGGVLPEGGLRLAEGTTFLVSLGEEYSSLTDALFMPS